jgi:hypothetical protein
VKEHLLDDSDDARKINKRVWFCLHFSNTTVLMCLFYRCLMAGQHGKVNLCQHHDSEFVMLASGIMFSYSSNSYTTPHHVKNQRNEYFTALLTHKGYYCPKYMSFTTFFKYKCQALLFLLSSVYSATSILYNSRTAKRIYPAAQLESSSVVAY